jgi:hypothetical protein
MARQGPPGATGRQKGDKIGKGTGWGVHAMSQREAVWILVGAVLIAAAGAGAFIVATYALSVF